MSDDYQILIPDSFMAVHTSPGRIKPDLARDELASRYEFCEDLASVLQENARNVIFDLSIAESDVLERMLAGLTAEPDQAVASEAESRWVIVRVAEMLGWDELAASMQQRWQLVGARPRMR